MTTDAPELFPSEDEPRTWRDRFATLASAAQALLKTRLAILREEIAEKAAFAAKGLIAVAVAGVVGAGALLLLAALLAAIFAQLLHSVVLGILAAFVLFGVLTAAAGLVGWRALSRIRPFDFVTTREEIEKDLAAVRAAGEPETPAVVAAMRTPPAEEEVGGIEERFRAGAE